MGLNRKLQMEIDRTLKRVADGKLEFEELWQKLVAMEVMGDCNFAVEMKFARGKCVLM